MRPAVVLALVLVGLPARGGEARTDAGAEAPAWEEELPPEERDDRTAIVMPRGHLFLPLLADPREFHPQAAVVKVHADAQNFNMASVAYGFDFGIVRKRHWQLDFAGALFAQFNLDAPSDALINADYLFGFSVTHRRGVHSFRARLIHMSSHLGDEFLLETPIERINLSVNAIDFVAAREWMHWRLYGGGIYALGIEPGNTKRGTLRVGAEYRGPRSIGRIGRLVGGLDVRFFEALDWEPSASLKTGVEWRKPGPGFATFRLVGEAYQGPFPFGQFILDNVRVRWFGVGAYFVH